MTNILRFAKMHGLGNDFVILNNLNRSINLTPKLILEWADRHRGIGFDQLLVLEPSTQADFYCRIFNADGNEVEQCGNGLRCLARYIKEEDLHYTDSFALQTKAGIYPVSIADFEHITVIMGAPHVKEKLFKIPSENYSMTILTIGNPHAIVKVESLDVPVAAEIAAKISSHDYFNDGANVGFMEIMNPQHIRLRTFERGVGETHCCGSNACAAVVSGIINEWLKSPVEVKFKYGSLFVEWENNNKFIQLIGPAAKNFEGKILVIA